MKFICTCCLYSTDKKANFDRHNTSKKHKNNINPHHSNLFECEICNYQTNRKYNLEVHQKIHTTRLDVIKCEVCSKSFSERRLVVQHVKTIKHAIKRNALKKYISKEITKEWNITTHDNGFEDKVLDEAEIRIKGKVFTIL